MSGVGCQRHSSSDSLAIRARKRSQTWSTRSTMSLVGESTLPMVANSERVRSSRPRGGGRGAGYRAAGGPGPSTDRGTPLIWPGGRRRRRVTTGRPRSTPSTSVVLISSSMTCGAPLEVAAIPWAASLLAARGIGRRTVGVSPARPCTRNIAAPGCARAPSRRRARTVGARLSARDQPRR